MAAAEERIEPTTQVQETEPNPVNASIDGATSRLAQVVDLLRRTASALETVPDAQARAHARAAVAAVEQLQRRIAVVNEAHRIAARYGVVAGTAPLHVGVLVDAMGRPSLVGAVEVGPHIDGAVSHLERVIVLLGLAVSAIDDVPDAHAQELAEEATAVVDRLRRRVAVVAEAHHFDRLYGAAAGAR